MEGRKRRVARCGLAGKHLKGPDCSHVSTITVVSGGLERVVCEDCGDVTIRYESMISGDVDRAKFARRADVLHARTTAIANADPD